MDEPPNIQRVPQQSMEQEQNLYYFGLELNGYHESVKTTIEASLSENSRK
jgi:hypothetical protein